DTDMHALQANGTKRWACATPAGIGAASPVIGLDGTIYCGSRDHILYALNPNGTKKWQFGTGAEIFSTPAISSSGTVYVTSADRNIYALNSNGVQQWSFTAGGVISASPSITPEGNVVFGCSDQKVYMIQGDGPLAISPWPVFHHDYKHTGRGLTQPSIQITSPSDQAQFPN